ncbi:MAG: type VII secretion target [Caldilineaceae bacterium]
MGEVYMDVPQVRDFAKAFGVISEVLETVSKVLEALILILKTTAFIGLVGGYAVAHFMEMIKPHIDEMADKCAELNKDLDASVDAYERGDEQGATRFY